jgi:hypothetical protein
MATRFTEQRAQDRSRVWVPLQLRWDGGESVAVTYDASIKGVLMLTRLPLAVGTPLTVTFDVPGHDGGAPQTPGPAGTPAQQRTGTGRVVRSGPNEDDPHGLWPHRVAVALDAAMEAFGAELERLAQEHPLVDSKR